MLTKRTLDKSDLESIEMDIISIRHEGSVQAYLESDIGKKYNHLLIYKLEKLLSELKGDE